MHYYFSKHECSLFCERVFDSSCSRVLHFFFLSKKDTDMHAKVSQAFQVFDMGIAPQMKCSYFLDVQFIILIVRCHFSLWTQILKNCKFVSCSPPQICSISTSTFSPCNFVGSKPIGCMCNLSIKINIKIGRAHV